MTTTPTPAPTPTVGDARVALFNAVENYRGITAAIDAFENAVRADALEASIKRETFWQESRDDWQRVALEALEEAKGHVRNHHLEPCESCMLMMSEVARYRAALEEADDRIGRAVAVQDWNEANPIGDSIKFVYEAQEFTAAALSEPSPAIQSAWDGQPSAIAIGPDYPGDAVFDSAPSPEPKGHAIAREAARLTDEAREGRPWAPQPSPEET